MFKKPFPVAANSLFGKHFLSSISRWPLLFETPDDDEASDKPDGEKKKPLDEVRGDDSLNYANHASQEEVTNAKYEPKKFLPSYVDYF